MEPVLIPWDCADGFFEAHWRRPEAYLDERVRRGVSVWARVGAHVEQRAVRSLQMTSHPAGGSNATATSSSDRSSRPTASCLSPEPAAAGYRFAARKPLGPGYRIEARGRGRWPSIVTLKRRKGLSAVGGPPLMTCGMSARSAGNRVDPGGSENTCSSTDPPKFHDPFQELGLNPGLRPI